MSPSDSADLDTDKLEHIQVRCVGHAEKVLFASALSAVRWESLYSLSTCQEQYEHFQGIMDQLTISVSSLENAREPVCLVIRYELTPFTIR